MGSKVSKPNSFNLREMDELSQFISNINMLDGFYMDTTLSISSKCLVIINKLINDESFNSVKLMSGFDISYNEVLVGNIEKLKFHCGLIRHLAVVNSSINRVEELVELNNVNHLTSLTLDHVSIQLVQHLKQHRHTLLKLCVYYSLDDLESLIKLCGGDHSFDDKWTNLLHLDLRYNNLRNIGDCVSLLTALTVLDISRNDIEDISFIKKIPTLVCLNASFNYIRLLPAIINYNLRVLIIGYNYLDGVEGIKGFKFLTTLNVSFNMITTNEYLCQIKEMDNLQDLILKGNPLSHAINYRHRVLDIVSPRVTIDFAIDGVRLNKFENIYLRKRAVIQIAPAPAALTAVYKEVPVIIANRNDLTNDGYSTGSPSNLNSYVRRNIQRVMIDNNSESMPHTKEPDDREPILRTLPHRDEKQMESFISLLNNDMTSPITDTVVSLEDTCSTRIPYFVGDKTSNFFLVTVDKGWKSFMHVSVQIIEHKLMVVDESDVIVDNTDMWTLLAITRDTVHKDTLSDNVLKMVFFVSHSTKNNEGSILCTRTVEFITNNELEVFSDQLSVYLSGFSITYENWMELPLKNISINCNRCSSIFIPNVDQPRHYYCSKCFGIDFTIDIVTFVSIESETPRNSPVSEIVEKLKDKSAITKILTPVLRRGNREKSLTSNLLIRTFGSMDSLLRRNEDKSSENSEGISYHTAINDSTIDQRSMYYSQDGVSERFLDAETENGSPDNEYDDDLMTLNLDKPINANSLSLTESINRESVHSPATRRKRLNLDKPIDLSTVSIESNIIPHLVFDDDARGLLKSKLSSAWVIHESASDVNIYMHSNSKIDDRVKLYFLTKVMHDQEDLIAVSKVYLAYRSTGLATASLVVVSNQRLIIYSLLDKISTSMDDCIKVVCDYKLKYLQQFEYSLNNQWIELQFKNKPIMALFIGDMESVTNIGVCITTAVSIRSDNLGITFSKGIDKMNCPQILAAMTSGQYDGVTLDSLSKGEAYLVKSCSILPFIEKSSMEYAPKLIVIESEHLFFITITYSGKNNQPVFELCRVISLLSVKTSMIIDSGNDCTVRLFVFEAGENKSVDITFMSPGSRSRAVFCVEKMLRALFPVEVLLTKENLSLVQ